MSQYQLEKIAKLKSRTFELYKTGLSMRQVASLVGMSTGWVHSAIQDVKALNALVDNSTDKTLYKNEQV